MRRSDFNLFLLFYSRIGVDQPRVQLHDQLGEVQRQTKNSEYDRKAYTEETLANVKKQR